MVPVKICGLKEPANIDKILELQPQFLGMVFYPQSPRYARDTLLPIQLQHIGNSTGKVGVFVNASVKDLVETVQLFFLSHVQLHGDEDIEYIRVLDKNLPGIQIIKAFQIAPGFDFSSVTPFTNHVSHVLFDTQSDSFGGSGKSFDWSILDAYRSGPTFFLSGGLSCDTVAEARSYVQKHPLGYGLDVSSQIEISPGVKSISLATRFLQEAQA